MTKKNSAIRQPEDKEASLSYYYGHFDFEQGKHMQRDPLGQNESCEAVERKFEEANKKRRKLSDGNS